MDCSVTSIFTIRIKFTSYPWMDYPNFSLFPFISQTYRDFYESDGILRLLVDVYNLVFSLHIKQHS